MLAGKDTHYESQLRKECYKDRLKYHGIELKESQVEECNMARSCHDEARKLLDRNLDAEAIFCVNDYSAFGLYDVLNERKIAIGKDIYVFGCDNAEFSSELNPSLSSIDLKHVGQGLPEFTLVNIK